MEHHTALVLYWFGVFLIFLGAACVAVGRWYSS